MNLLLLVVGVGLVVAAVIDQLWTTLWVDGGAGPLSARASTAVWRVFRRATGPDNSPTLTIVGPLILVTTLALWIGLSWAGWTLVFASGEDALLDTQGRGPVTWSDLLYYVGYSIFTLGMGDLVPAGSVWQLATVLATANGMLFITLGVSYVLSVVGAVVDKRSFAGSVTGLGRDGPAFVRAGWDGEDLRDLDLPLDTLAAQLDRLVDQHKAYPILHYYQPADIGRASTVAVVIFDEALTILRSGVPEGDRPNTALLESGRESSRTYLETLSGVYVHPADTTPPPPDLTPVRDVEIPTVSDEAFADTVADLADHRRKLLGMIEVGGWDWPGSKWKPPSAGTGGPDVTG